jgi:hypothetical protein
VSPVGTGHGEPPGGSGHDLVVLGLCRLTQVRLKNERGAKFFGLSKNPE